MKRKIFAILVLCALPVATFAQRAITVGWPQDDPNARREVYSRAELQPLIAEYNQVIKTNLGTLKPESIEKVFGRKVAERGLLARGGDPTNSVAPVFAPYSLSFSGLLTEDKSHRDLYAIGSIGYVEFFYELDGTLKTALLYARLDDQFVPLKSTNDFSRRLEWDKAKFQEIRAWLGKNTAAKDVPNSGYVIDATAATEIAKVVLSRLLTPENLKHKEIFDATLKDGIWTVQCAELKVRISAPIVIQIRQKTGAIVKYEDPNA